MVRCVVDRFAVDRFAVDHYVVDRFAVDHYVVDRLAVDRCAVGSFHCSLQALCADLQDVSPIYHLDRYAVGISDAVR